MKNNKEFEDNFDKLRSKVLRYVLYKKRTEKEVRDKFIKENQEYIEDIIEFLKEDNYLNEIEYIKIYFEESIILRNLSIKEIEYKLIEKGIEKSDIKEYISKNKKTLEEYETESASKLLNKRKDKDADINISYLLNKGYSIDNIRKAISKIEE